MVFNLAQRGRILNYHNFHIDTVLEIKTLEGFLGKKQDEDSHLQV